MPEAERVTATARYVRSGSDSRDGGRWGGRAPYHGVGKERDDLPERRAVLASPCGGTNGMVHRCSSAARGGGGTPARAERPAGRSARAPVRVGTPSAILGSSPAPSAGRRRPAGDTERVAHARTRTRAREG